MHISGLQRAFSVGFHASFLLLYRTSPGHGILSLSTSYKEEVISSGSCLCVLLVGFWGASDWSLGKQDARLWVDPAGFPLCSCAPANHPVPCFTFHGEKKSKDMQLGKGCEVSLPSLVHFPLPLDSFHDPRHSKTFQT